MCPYIVVRFRERCLKGVIIMLFLFMLPYFVAKFGVKLKGDNHSNLLFHASLYSGEISVNRGMQSVFKGVMWS